MTALYSGPTMQESYGTGGRQHASQLVADGETPQLIRRLTPLECERLKDFPGRLDSGSPGASDSARDDNVGW